MYQMICKVFLFLYGFRECICRQAVRGQIGTSSAPDRKQATIYAPYSRPDYKESGRLNDFVQQSAPSEGLSRRSGTNPETDGAEMIPVAAVFSSRQATFTLRANIRSNYCVSLLRSLIKHDTRMNLPLYEYSLCIALPLMIFFGAYFLLAPAPDKAIFANYLRSRRIMGCALLLLAANYAVHFFFEIRFRDVHAAILMNLSTYFLCYWLFSSALTTLLDRFYITRRRLRFHLSAWALFTLLSGVILLGMPEGAVQRAGLTVMAAWLVGYGLWLARRLIRAYRRAVRLFDDTRSDDIGAYIRWMSVFTYWAVIFGVGCGLLTFLPDRYVFLWILSSVPFYIYLYCSYMNYLLLYERVEQALEEEIPAEEAAAEVPSNLEGPDGRPDREARPLHTDLAVRLSGWIAANGYLRPGLTIRELADTLHTNRTYLSEYIKATYDRSFRDWISGLRIDHAKQMLLRSPELTILEIAEKSGFLSPSHFMRTFKEHEACSPARWRRMRVFEEQTPEQ